MKASKWTKSTAASVLVAPLVLTTPGITQISAEGVPFHEWVSLQLGERFEVGQTITLDLSAYFGDLDETTFMIINHNHHVAVISIKDGEMTIDGRSSGSTVVDLLVEGAESSPVNERFRLQVNPAEGLIDQHGDGLGLDDIIQYIRTNPEQTFRRENLTHLLEHVSTIIQPNNQPPKASDEHIHLTLRPGGEFVLLHLHDFFFDPDGDQLQYSFVYDDEVVAVQQDEHMAAIGGFGLIGTQSTIEITASDEHSGHDVSKTLILTFAPDDAYSPPEALTPIPDQTAWEDSLFTFTVPQGTFSEVSEFDRFTYAASLDNGDPLPSWLTFDPDTLTFSGVPMQEGEAPITGMLGIRVTATSGTGDSTSSTFQVSILASDLAIPIYESIQITIRPGQSLNIDLPALFTSEEETELEIISVDGKNSWFSEPFSFLLGDLYANGMYSVITSGGTVEPTDTSTLQVQFQAKGSKETLSDVIDITTTYEPLIPDPFIVQAGTEFNMKNIAEEQFEMVYQLDGKDYTWGLSWEGNSSVGEFTPDDTDIFEFYPHIQGTFYFELTASFLEGAITIVYYFPVEVIPSDGG